MQKRATLKMPENFFEQKKNDMLIQAYNRGVDFNACKDFVEQVGVPKDDFDYMLKIMQMRQNPLAQF